MELTVTPKAQQWFKQEVGVQAHDGIRFFGKVYGSTPVHEGFSIGISIEKPENALVIQHENNISYFIDESDEWFFQEYNLIVDYDEKLEEPVYIFDAIDQHN